MVDVLIVDDDFAFSGFARRILEDGGLRTEIASSGAEGLAKAEASRPGLILLDLAMGDMDGFEVLKVLKSRPGTATIPVVICSMSKELKVMNRGLELGAVAVMSKPLAPAEAVAAIKTFLGRGAGPR